MKPDDTHDCPGGCGRQIPHRLFACLKDWRRLPFHLRIAISGNHGRDRQAHARAMVDAIRWYAAQTKGATR